MVKPSPFGGTGLLHADFLVPAVLARHRIGVNRKRKVLVDSGLIPPDPFRVGVVALERSDPFPIAEQQLAGSRMRQVHEGGGPALSPLVRSEPPAPQVVGSSRSPARSLA